MASSLSRKETPVERVERRTRRSVAIETSLTEDNLAKCYHQSQSPLFQLPKELRDLIFEYASTQSEDPNYHYEDTSYYYRPGHKARHKTHTSFLFSCRRIWLEAHATPMQQAEHTFWFQRGPYDQRSDAGWAVNLRHENDRFARFFQGLTALNLQNLSYIHLVMQMFQAQEFWQPRRMESLFWNHYIHRGLRLKTFHITIRQSDWWNWEHGAPLSLDGQSLNDEGRWVQAVLDAPQLGCVNEFKLELETLESKIEQLNRIVERLQRLEGKPLLVDLVGNTRLDRNKFVCRDPPRRWQWKRSTKLDGKNWAAFKDIKELRLHVVELSWKKQPTEPLQLRDTPQLSSTKERRSAFPLPFHTTPILSPSMILRMRSRKALMNEMKWSQSGSFSQYTLAMRAQSDEQAVKYERERRELFERMIADMEANDIKQRWEGERSLLKYVEL